MKKDISKIIARHLIFSASDEEKKILRKWRSIDERNEKGYQVMKKLFHHGNIKENHVEENISVDTFFSRTRLQQTEKRALSWWKAAVSVAALLAIGLMISQFLYFFDNTHVELLAGSGQRTEAVLPDGSKVWLNNCSHLVYEHRFGRQRSVNLKGEAYFEVEKDVTSPFYVETGDLEVRVTGTRFNVKNYESDSVIEVALVRGSVDVKSYNGNKVTMIPGEMVSMTKKSGRLVRRRTDVSENSAWRDGVLVFKDDSFDHLIARLEKWYDIRIEYNHKDFRGIHYTGTIRNLRLDQVFDFVNLTIPIEVQMKAKHIVLSKK
jgi:ferric-dicitrate binding protein FerR (iron transport regulator)